MNQKFDKKRINIYSVFFICILFIENQIYAGTIKFNPPNILARAHFSESYNLPPDSYLFNLEPVLNNNGDIAFKVILTGDDEGEVIWSKNHSEEKGDIIYSAPDDLYLTSPTINDSGIISFALFDENQTEGLMTLNSQTKKCQEEESM